MARQREDVRELILLLGEGIYDELISLNLRGDLLFELCALPRPVPLLAVEKIKKRNFSSKALKIAYEIILFRRYQWFSLYRKSLDHGMSSIDRCFGVVYVLRTSGREEQGVQLEKALNTLTLCDMGWKESVLYLLYKLSNSLTFEPEPVTLPETLEMDLKKMSELSQRYREHSRAVLSCEPGTGFSGWYHAKERRATTLLSALSRHAAVDSCFVLSLPQYVEGYSFPHAPTSYRPRRDSIFSEESTLTPVQQQTDLPDPIELSDSGIGHSEEDTTCSNDSWSSVWSKLDLSEPPQQAYMSITSERSLPYLTEAGSGAFDLVHKVYMRGLLSLAGVSPPLTTLCTMDQLVQSTYCVLHGTPSAHYTLDEETTAFQPTRGLYVVGTSYEACGRILSYFAEIGTFYLRLEQSVHTLLVLGIVYKGIATALQSFLQLFLESVLQTSESKKYTSLLGVRIALHQELSHLRYLAGLFGIDTRWPLAPSSLPKGAMVLDSLYEASLHSAGTAHAALALSMLRNAMKSFLLYLQQWVFFGVCVDQEEEFGIRENPRALAARDHTHWFEGYSLADKQFVPLFMSSVVANQIFTCGKALLLLKRCSPGNYVFDQSLKHPKLRIVYSNQNLADMEKECLEYESTVVDHGRKWLVEMRERKDRQQKERMEATIKGRKVLLLEAAQARKLEEEKMATQAALKKAELQRLKDQMEQDKVRRALDVQEEKTSDKKMVEQAVRVEREEDERTRKLKQEAKDELIAYYEQLTFEAEKRERRAIWRKRRIELNQKRKEFILNSSETLGGSDLLDTPTVTGGTGGSSSLKTSSGSVHLEKPSLPAENTSNDASLENTLRDHPPTDTPSAGSRPTDTPSAGSRPTDTPLTGSRPTDTPLTGSRPTDTPSTGSRPTDTPSTGSRPTDTPSTGSSPTDTPSAGSRPTDTPSAGSRPTDTPSAGSRPTDPPSTGSRPTDPPSTGSRPANSLLSVHVTPPPDTKTPPPDTKTPPPDTKTPPPDTKTPPPEETIHQLTNLKVPPIDTPTTSDMHSLELVVHGGSSASTRGHAPPTVIEGLLYPDSQPVPMETHTSTRGQEPPSQIQFLMYPKQEEGGGCGINQEEGRGCGINQEEGGGRGINDVALVTKEGPVDWLNVDSLWMDYKAQPYESHAFLSDGSAHMDRLYKAAGIVLEDYRDDYVDPEAMSPLSVVLDCCVTTPLRIQASLVNSALVTYFIEELNIKDHFVALRRFLLLEDGEFGHTLSNGLFEELSSLNPAVRLTSFVFLNPLLTSALQSSIYGDTVHASRLSFGLKYIPHTIDSTASDALDFLELHYTVDWPCNIAITEDMLSKYNKILHFFLQLKRTSWALKDVFHYLKHCEGRGTLTHEQIRELLTFRYDMQHFVTVVQGYMANQVVHISWEEFQESLSSQVSSLDDLHRCHSAYINRAIFRSLLSRKASAVMKIVQEVFNHIHKFRAQLITAKWHHERHTITNYSNLCATYSNFRRKTLLLFMIVTKLVQRGYQPHLEDLLLRINYNGFFTQ